MAKHAPSQLGSSGAALVKCDHRICREGEAAESEAIERGEALGRAKLPLSLRGVRSASSTGAQPELRPPEKLFSLKENTETGMHNGLSRDTKRVRESRYR